MSILYRSAPLSPGAGRTIYGKVVPYGDVIEVSDGSRPYFERFEYGSFARSVSERSHKVKLMCGHDYRRLPVGKATELREQQDGLHAAFQVADTAAGNEALELVRSGVVDAFSVGFRGIRERVERQDYGDVVVRTEAALLEVSLVGVPAYEGALVGGVRSQLVIPRSLAQARLTLMDW